MSITNFRIIAKIVIFLSFFSCTVKYTNTASDFSEQVKSTKRLVIQIAPESNLRQKESMLLRDITKEQVSHHKEFLVYPTPEKFTGNCKKESPKAEGILFVTPLQEVKNKEISVNLKISLLQCTTKNILWEAEAKNSFSMNDKQNESLRNTYTQKYGKEIEYAINPYFLLTKDVLESLPSPALTDAEQDEKIELDSK